MNSKDYPVTYTCKYKDPLNYEERFENYHCIDRASALQQAKEDFNTHQFVQEIEFHDDDFKFTFEPYDDKHAHGTISVMFSDNFGWSEKVDDFFDVPIGQIDHADKQSLMRCYVEIAAVWDKYRCLKSAFLEYADNENDNIISFIHEYSDVAELVRPIIKKYYGDCDMIDQQILLWSKMYWGGFFRKDFKNET